MKATGFPTIIGSDVTIGHSVTLHGCTIEDGCLIGMSATILDGVVIGKESIVGAGSLVTPNKKFPPRSMIMGSPAKVVRELSDEESKDYMSTPQGMSLLKQLSIKMGTIEILRVADFIGIASFALSGLAAVRHKLDIFGIALLAFLTALGGGIARDVIVGKLPYSMQNFSLCLIVLATFGYCALA